MFEIYYYNFKIKNYIFEGYSSYEIKEIVFFKCNQIDNQFNYELILNNIIEESIDFPRLIINCLFNIYIKNIIIPNNIINNKNIVLLIKNINTFQMLLFASTYTRINLNNIPEFNLNQFKEESNNPAIKRYVEENLIKNNEIMNNQISKEPPPLPKRLNQITKESSLFKLKKTLPIIKKFKQISKKYSDSDSEYEIKPKKYKKKIIKPKLKIIKTKSDSDTEAESIPKLPPSPPPQITFKTIKPYLTIKESEEDENTIFILNFKYANELDINIAKHMGTTYKIFYSARQKILDLSSFIRNNNQRCLMGILK